MKNIIFWTVTVGLLAAVAFLGWWQWQRYGVATDWDEESFPVLEEKTQNVTIYAVNRRVGQGEKLALSRLAKASDTDGSDLSAKLRCYDEKGKRLTGFLDTETPGSYILVWKVKSACTGRSVQKKMIVLVDGRIRH